MRKLKLRLNIITRTGMDLIRINDGPSKMKSNSKTYS